MAGGSVKEIRFENECSARLLKWKIKQGSVLSQSTVLFLYDDQFALNDATVTNSRKFKNGVVGTVAQVLAQEGDILEPGCPLLTIQGCSHPIVMKNMCAECGADLKDVQREKQSSASVAMVHCVPELMVSQEQAEILGQADERRLLELRKLVLLVDLDQTLIHTTNDEIPPNIKDVYHFQLYGPRSPWYHTRLRPGTMSFLKNMSKLFELHICTFGARPYAHTIAHFLDKDGRYFSHRILSRDECFSQNSKTANLKALFPCGDSLVCIIDDREDVWNFTPNLVHVKPYNFFKHTGDINAPPGLAKTERDSDDPNTKLFEGVSYKKNGKHAFEVLDLSTNSEEVKSVEENKSVEDAEKSPSDELDVVAKDSNGDNPNKNLDVVSETDAKPEDVDVNGKDAKPEDVDVNGKEAKPEEVDVNGKEAKSEEMENGENVVTEEKISDNDENTKVDNLSTSSTKVETEAPKDVKDDTDKDKMTASKAESGDGTSEEMIEVNDKDDYLLYLGDILKTIHQAYYDIYDQLKAREQLDIPDMKNVVPYVRRKILKGVFVVFSGVYPTNMTPDKSRAWIVAKAFGAEIHPNIIPRKKPGAVESEATTHVVAARLGTAKVNEAKKRGLHIVTPDWLWCCAERWERVDEKLFPLVKDLVIEDPYQSSKSSFDASAETREERSSSGSDQKKKEPQVFPTYDRVTGKRINKRPEGATGKKASWSAAPSLVVPSNDGVATCSSLSFSPPASPSADFANTINPLLSFSSEDIEKMDREVEDILDGSESESKSESEDEESKLKKIVLGRKKKRSASESSSSQEEYLEPDRRKDKKCLRKKRKREYEENESERSETRDMFPRGQLPSDSERSNRTTDSDDFNESVGSVDEEMAAAVEREFMGI